MADWAEHWHAEPWGPGGDDLQFAALRRAVFAAAGAKNLPDVPAFMLRPPARSDEMTVEQTKKALGAVLNAKTVRAPTED